MCARARACDKQEFDGRTELPSYVQEFCVKTLVLHDGLMHESFPASQTLLHEEYFVHR